MGAAIWTAVVAAAKGGGADGDGGRVEDLPLTFEAPAPAVEGVARGYGFAVASDGGRVNRVDVRHWNQSDGSDDGG